MHVVKLNFINDYKDEEEKLNSEPVSDNIHVHVVQRNVINAMITRTVTSSVLSMPK